MDVGGTFTDFVGFRGSEVVSLKLPSTRDPSAAVLEGMRALVAAGMAHGTTVATNAILERKGARTAFVTTEGFPHPRFWETRLGRRFVVGPERVALAIVTAVEKDKPEVVVPWFPYGLAPIAEALFPTLTTRVMAFDSYRPDPTRPGEQPNA